MATCGEVLVKLLEDYGVEQVFGIPGVHTVELYRGLARSSINHVTPRHEQGAGFMADGYARTSGKPGVCFIITGPGMTNITTAMGQAYADSIPMLVISSVQIRNQLGGGRGKLHELPNQSALVGGVAAFSHTLMSASELPGVLARAFALFQAGRPRPVHIEIPLDVLVEEADDLLASLPVNIDRAGASPSAVSRMTELLAGAKRPLILAGGGAIDAAAELTELAELLDAPVALTINAKGMLESAHPLLIGSTQSLVATRALVAEADVVLAIGTELAETDYDVTFAGGFEIPGKLLRVDIDPDQTVRNYPPHVALVSDSRNAAQALLSALSHKSLAERRNDWGQVRAARLREELAANLGCADPGPDPLPGNRPARTAGRGIRRRFDPTGVHRQPDLQPGAPASLVQLVHRLRHPRLRLAGGDWRLAGRQRRRRCASSGGVPDRRRRPAIHPAGTGQCR